MEWGRGMTYGKGKLSTKCVGGPITSGKRQSLVLGKGKCRAFGEGSWHKNRF